MDFTRSAEGKSSVTILQYGSKQGVGLSERFLCFRTSTMELDT